MPSGSWRSVAASIALVAALAVVLAARLQDGGGTRALLQRGASLHMLPRSSMMIAGSENAEHGARKAAEEAATGGFTVPESLLTAPVLAAEDLVRQESQADGSDTWGAAIQVGKAHHRVDGGLSADALQTLSLHTGQVLHIRTGEGRLPLVVDGEADARGDIPVRANAKGVRYEGSIRVGTKFDGISFPEASPLRSSLAASRSGQETDMQESIRRPAAGRTVPSQLAISPDGGLTATINSRVVPTPQGAVHVDRGLAHGSPGSPAAEGSISGLAALSVPRRPGTERLRAMSRRVLILRDRAARVLRHPASARAAAAARRRGRGGERTWNDARASARLGLRGWKMARGGGVEAGGEPLVPRAKEFKGYFDVSDNSYVAVNLRPVACAVGSGVQVSRRASCGFSQHSCRQGNAHVHLRVDLVCPPYPAVAHGRVWYKGRPLNHTASGGRRYLEFRRGRELVRLPMAAEGDVARCDKVEIRCDEHYELDGRANAFPDPYCLQSGEYEEGQSCVPISCPPYPAPAYGEVWPSGRVKAGDRVVISCASGYQAEYERGGRRNPMCLDSRRYEAGITCVPIYCTPYQAPAHATVAPAGRVLVGQRVTIACNQGYRAKTWLDGDPARWPRYGAGVAPADLAGSAAPACLPSGTYEEGVTCVPVPVRCPAYPAPRHGSVWGPGGEFKVESPGGLLGWPRQQHLFITCDRGFRLSQHGRQTIRCLRSGEWEQGKTCVRIMCPPFAPPEHGSFRGPRGFVPAGHAVLVTCDEGYQAAGALMGTRLSRARALCRCMHACMHV